MNKTVLVALAAVAVVAGAASAQAQQGYGQNDYRGRDDARITFFEQPNFQGRSFTLDRDDDNFVNDGFNDRAQSARVTGVWRVCEHVNYQGRCEELRDDVRDLNRIGMGGTISSANLLRGGGGGGRPPWDDAGGFGGQRLEGRTAVFFPEPRFRGRDLPAGKLSADMFCRRMNLGASIHSAADRGRGMGPDGRDFNGPVLRDVLCRR
jgi:hypothetical protein